MGKLIYGAIQRQIVMDDRLLAHLEAVVLSRLRRNNAFALHWKERSDTGEGRRTVWVHPAADLYFEYDSANPGEMDRELLDGLAKAADSNQGINLHFDASDAIWVADS